MTTCSGLEGHCDVPRCKKHHEPFKNVTSVAYHICNKDCKNDQKHKEILMSFNDSAPKEVIDSFAVHNVFINRSFDKNLQLTDTTGNAPLSIFLYDKNKKVYYHAENIFNHNNNPPSPNLKGKINADPNNKQEENKKNFIKNIKTFFAKFLFASLTAAILVGIAFTIPQARAALLKNFSRIKTKAAPLLKNYSGKIKTGTKSISKKISGFFKNSQAKAATVAASKPVINTNKVAPALT